MSSLTAVAVPTAKDTFYQSFVVGAAISRICAQEACSSLRVATTYRSKKDFEVRQQELRMATRTTPRHDYVQSVLEANAEKMTEDVRHILSYADTVSASHPFSRLRNMTLAQSPLGVAIQFPFAAHSESPQSVPLHNGAALCDLELEDEGSGQRLVGVRPWLSTVLGCDCTDEGTHQKLVDEVLLDCSRNVHDSLYFILPDSRSPIVSRARSRLQRFLQQHPHRLWHICSAEDVGRSHFWFCVNPLNGRLEAYDPESLHRVVFVMPIAIEISRWPDWLKDCFNDQDIEKNALLSKITEVDRADVGTVWEPECYKQVFIGRRSAVIAESQAWSAIWKLADSISIDGLLRLRQRGSDKALVMDYRRDFQLFQYMLHGAGSSGLIIEEPPRRLAAMHREGREYHAQTITAVTAPAALSEKRVSSSVQHCVNATFTCASQALPLVQQLTAGKMPFHLALTDFNMGVVQWIQTSHDEDAQLQRVLVNASHVSISQCRVLEGMASEGWQEDSSNISLKCDLARVMQTDIRYGALLLSAALVLRLSDEAQLRIARDAMRTLFLGQGRVLWSDFLRYCNWRDLVTGRFLLRYDLSLGSVRSAADLLDKLVRIINILRESGCDHQEIGGCVYRLLDMFVAKAGENSR
jgi:hypothetical protein